MKKKILLTFTTVFISLFALGVLNVSATTYGDLTYEVENGEVIITDCKTSAISVTIPAEIEGYPVTSIGNYAFYRCSSLTSVEIPDSVTSIGNYAFYGCSSLTSIEIPDSVTSISSDAFSDCISLTSIEIPDGVTRIEERIFLNCSSLTSIEIPDGVTSIGIKAFYNTGYYNNSSNWENGNVLYIGNYLIDVKRSKSGSYVIKSGTKIIADHTFYGCDGLQSVTIPDSVTSIGEDAFYICNILTSIDVDENNLNYSSIDGVLFDEEQKILMKYPMGKNDASYSIPESVTDIAENAFYGCDGLQSVTIPDSVTSIGAGAFNDCGSLIGVTIPYGVTIINKYTFKNCDSLQDVIIPESVTSIGDGVFCECDSLQSMSIPDNVTSIGAYVFDECKSLTKVNMPEGVTRIEDKTFYLCRSLKSVNIPESVTSIGSHAFYECNSLTEVDIPNGVTNIEDSAFLGCESLTKINIPEGVTSISNQAFAGCEGLTSVNIPDGVESIGNWAFTYCNGLTSVSIPDGVQSIGDLTFGWCNNIMSIEIPTSVTRIGNEAFKGVRDMDIYYAGSEADWKKIIIGKGNKIFLNGNFIFNYNPIKVFYNGEKMSFDQPPVMDNNRTLVPLRAIFEKIGAEVDWNSETQTVTAKKDDTTIELTINNTNTKKNGSVIELDVPAKIINNRTLVPVRFVSDCFGVGVEWDGENRQVILTTK